MDVATFRSLAEGLTGTPVKDLTESDEAFLTQILQNDEREIDCSQFNELLLLINKDRIEPAFFLRFFGPGCRISGIRGGVRKFQVKALLCFGNFIFAYRTLSRIRTAEALEKELGPYARNPEEVIASFAARADKLIEIEQIQREDTALVGYLSAGAIIAENGRAVFGSPHL